MNKQELKQPCIDMFLANPDLMFKDIAKALGLHTTTVSVFLTEYLKSLKEKK